MKRETLMKIMNGNIIFGKYYFFSCLFLIFLNSCAKSDRADLLNDGKTRLIIDVVGVKSSTLEPNKQASISPNLNQGIKESIESFTAKSTQGDLIIDVVSRQQDIVTENVERANSSLVSGFPKLSASTRVPIDRDIKYAFYIYSITTGNLIDSVVATVGEPISIGIPKTDSFSWYAYSYNSIDSIELPMDLQNLVIPTDVRKPLLYASGTLNAASIQVGDNPIQIEFEHKLAKLAIEIDTRGMYADMINLDATFVGNSLTAGNFNLKTGQMDASSIVPVDVGKFNLVNVDPMSNRIKRSTRDFYTSTRLSSYQIKFTEFIVTYPNNVREDVVAKFPDSGVATFVFTNQSSSSTYIAKELKGILRPYLLLSTQSILHYGTQNSQRGFEAQVGSASGNFLSSAYNFSPTSKYVKINSLTRTSIGESSGGVSRLADRLSDPLTYPDIVICAALTNNAITVADLEALKTYLLRRGTVFLLTETVDVHVRDFLRDLLNEPNLTLFQHDDGGAVYELSNNVDAQVINGVFGDLTGAYWGQDGSPTQYMRGISNMSNIVAYTGESVNFPAPTPAPTPADPVITMFRHKTLNLFFVGDTGFLSNSLSTGGTDNSITYGRPYATTGSPNHFPIVKDNFRPQSAPPAIDTRNYTVSNSIIFANAFAWLLERAYFMGVDRSPVSVQDEVIQVKDKNWNFQRD